MLQLARGQGRVSWHTYTQVKVSGIKPYCMLHYNVTVMMIYNTKVSNAGLAKGCTNEQRNVG